MVTVVEPDDPPTIVSDDGAADNVKVGATTVNVSAVDEDVANEVSPA
jgi:hypothetical protein